ncbi:hypothetical protein Poly24_38590 [Rosistilla carotiformis]|uniref:Uncharacterized protein n=1 Tax=Rosistilla carotiformis TaxID=2528017 RepID=A0A518JX68_9BACT|nr:hypothetical protein [Rosistilla carotiformis]QDV70140.1 hypothetical protein Poly24_38590 [Rosistilla carotiformis]
MPSHASKQQYSEQTLRQVAADCRRSLQRGQFDVEQSRVERLRCVDDQLETEEQFGRQLWYFEGRALSSDDRRVRVYGVIEYSVQFGLQELIEDGVFDAPDQRDRFREIYHHVPSRFSWRHPSIRMLIAGSIGVGTAYLAYVASRLIG